MNGPLVGMLLIVISLILLIGLMILFKLCCNCDKTRSIPLSSSAPPDSVVSVIHPLPGETTAHVNRGFDDIQQLDLPPSYDEAIKLPSYPSASCNPPPV